MTDKKPAHRPKGTTIFIDWEKVDNMCAIQCTGEEIAGVLDIDYDTLSSACKREKNLLFSDYIGQKKSGGKMSLRRKQYSTAMAGNATMLVWLGKNWLGQTDKLDTTSSDGSMTPPTTIQLVAKEFGDI
jgi:hypothetical protein|tara:strand:+ start:702 stop:1088 length:387 start_codon:yes stop_codon:yes gene_type:complete